MKIAIASGKGGTGKTTLAVNLYHIIAKHYDARVVLVDCDVEEPNDLLFFPQASLQEDKAVNLSVPQIDTAKCTFCRKCSDYCEFNAITVIPPLQHAEIAADLCHACGACLHACKFDAISENPYEIGRIRHYNLYSGLGLVEGRLKVGSALQTPVIRALKKEVSSPDSIIIYDAPPGTSCSVVSTLADADYVVLVSEPTPFGLHDLRLAITLVRELDKDFGLVINKAGMGDDELEDYLTKEKIPILGKIPFDKAIARHYSGNAMLADVIPGYAEHILEIASKILKKPKP